MTNKRQYTNICKVCGKEFHPFSRDQPTCSQECGHRYAANKRRNRVTKTCEVCGGKYEVKAYRAESSHYCSKDCWENRNPPDTKTCPECGKNFETYQRDQIYCSRECSGKSRTGEDANAWQGGVSLKNERARNGNKLAEWRKAVYQRDEYTCQSCGAKGDLHAHHIKPFAKFPELRYNIDNGVTLCVQCHGVVHHREFGNRRAKTCPDCGAETSGRGEDGLCRSCSIRRWHQRQGHNPDRICPTCQQVFKGRPGQVYCSTSCAMVARHASNNSG